MTRYSIAIYSYLLKLAAYYYVYTVYNTLAQLPFIYTFLNSSYTSSTISFAFTLVAGIY
jgi:hypothetical protein